MSELLKKKFTINGKPAHAEEDELVNWSFTSSYMGILLRWEGLICGVGHYESWKELERELEEWKQEGNVIEGYSPTPDREIPDMREEVYFDYDY